MSILDRGLEINEEECNYDNNNFNVRATLNPDFMDRGGMYGEGSFNDSFADRNGSLMVDGMYDMDYNQSPDI